MGSVLGWPPQQHHCCLAEHPAALFISTPHAKVSLYSIKAFVDQIPPPPFCLCFPRSAGRPPPDVPFAQPLSTRALWHTRVHPLVHPGGPGAPCNPPAATGESASRSPMGDSPASRIGLCPALPCNEGHSRQRAGPICLLPLGLIKAL